MSGLSFDIRKVPCLTDSFLYGALGGSIVGCVVMLTTSRGQLSLRAGMYTYLTVQAGYFVQCRSKKYFADMKAWKQKHGDMPLKVPADIEVRMDEA